MEDLGQAYGYILYRKTIAAPVSGDLVLDQLHDYALVYANGKLLGTLDRRLDQNHIAVDLNQPNTRLDILVENTGRVNFTTVIRGERKGITNQVTLAGKPINDWEIYPLPMADPTREHYQPAACTGPCFYRATLQISQPADTFLDTAAFTKGFVWINGHPLGRIWNIGPQQTLYVPAPWLNQGANEVIVFDLAGGSDKSIEGKPAPILNGSVKSQ
jgi:beta-galactosidase